jgi:hypothetical protein
MKFLIFILLIISQTALAESLCDIRLGQSVGVRVIEFVSGQEVHSKIALREMSLYSLKEEMTSLQDMGICEAKIQRKRCVLKFEKKDSGHQITMFRNQERWLSWNLNGKESAQKFVRILKQAGYCL